MKVPLIKLFMASFFLPVSKLYYGKRCILILMHFMKIKFPCYSAQYNLIHMTMSYIKPISVTQLFYINFGWICSIQIYQEKL